ncbi:unnamed protein product [Closterium sp. NIES-54]
MSADKLSARAIPCVFLGFPPDSDPFFHLFTYRSSTPPLPPLFLTPGPCLVDPLPPQGPAPSGVSQVEPLPGTVPIDVAGDSDATRGTASGGAKSGVAEPGVAELAGVEPGGVEPGGAESKGAESGGAEPRGAASSGGPVGASPRLSPQPELLSTQKLREWLVQHACLRSGAAGALATGDTGAGGTGGIAAAELEDPTDPGAGGAGGGGDAGAGGARARGTGAGDAGAGRTGAGGTRAGGARVGGTRVVDPAAGGAGGNVRPRPYFVPLLQQVLLPYCVQGLASCSRRYIQPPHFFLLLLTLSRPAVFQSVMSLRLVLPPLFALVVAFLVRVPLLSPAHTLWHFVLPLFHCVFHCCGEEN